MAISKRYTRNPDNISAVMALYLAKQKPTIEAIAAELGTTYQNVSAVVRSQLSAERLKQEKALRYSRSKMGVSNPMKGKMGADHHNHKGDIGDGYGYLQRKVNGKYVFVHRIVMAELLGVENIPSGLAVHHIDEDRKNNHPDNLALVTNGGHRQLHAKRSKFEKLPLWAQWESGTSK
jgi:hypothetical protein